MSNYFATTNHSEARPRYHSSNRYDYQSEKGRNQKDIRVSNISQQTIIHKARLTSPDKHQQYGFKGYNNQIYEKTRTKKQIANKIHEIMGLCQRDREADVQEFGGVIVVQKKILDMLQKESQNQLPTLDLSSVVPDYERGTTFGPIRNPNSTIPKAQSRQITERQINNNEKELLIRNNIYRKSAIEDLKTDRNGEDAGAQDIRGQPSQQNFQLPDGAFEMIEEIQRKAIQEIEGLRRDKIQLMRKLNEEIKAHNQQKKLRIRLQNELAKLRGINMKEKTKSYSQPHSTQTQPMRSPHQKFPQNYYSPFQTLQNVKIASLTKPQIIPNPQGLYVKEINKIQNQNYHLKKANQFIRRQNEKQALKHQIVSLNEKIQRYQFEIQRLRSTKDTDVLQAHALLEEGQRIKSQALRLLRLHGYEVQNNNPLFFEERHTRDNESPQIFEDMQNFKRRLVELEEQNEKLKSNLNQGAKRDFEEGFGGRDNFPIKNIASRKQIITDKRMKQFEEIIGDMQNAIR